MFGRSRKIYNVYIKKDVSDPFEQMEFVPEGFSLLAVFLTFFWALYYRVWSLAAFSFAVLTALEFAYLQGFMPEDMTSVLRLVFSLWVGFEANDWRASSLERRGYILYDVVSGTSEEEARIRFLDNNFSGYGNNTSPVSA